MNKNENRFYRTKEQNQGWRKHTEREKLDEANEYFNLPTSRHARLDWWDKVKIAVYENEATTEAVEIKLPTKPIKQICNFQHLIKQELRMERKHLTELLLEYAFVSGVKAISGMEGLWKHDLDENWTIKCNGHDKEIESVPPYSWSIEFNGFPAGIIDVMTGEGIICNGEAGNEENLRKVLESKISSYK